MQRLSASAVPAAVCAITRSIAWRPLGLSRSRSPSTRTRTPRSRSSSDSRAMYSSSRPMSASISVAGRCQFSRLKAKSVSTSTPASRQPATTSRTDFIPAWWPSGRGSERPVAQRPLPSMMTATCCGTAPWRRMRSSAASAMPSDFHDLGFLRRHQLVHLAHVLVGELLHLLLRARLVVLGDLLELLHLGERVGPRMPDGDLALLRELVDDLHQLPSALLGEHRQRHPDHRALRGRIESEVGVADCL